MTRRCGSGVDGPAWCGTVEARVTVATHLRAMPVVRTTPKQWLLLKTTGAPLPKLSHSPVLRSGSVRHLRVAADLRAAVVQLATSLPPPGGRRPPSKPNHYPVLIRMDTRFGASQVLRRRSWLVA